MMPSRTTRAHARGAAMVEAIFVISIFILFFLGMAYFRSMYQQKLRVSRLARAAAVGYALGGCNGSPLQSVTADLGSASDNGSTSQLNPGGPAGASGSKPTVGQNGGNPVGSALASQGMVGDPIAVINMQAPAAGTSQASPATASMGFKANVSTNSYMSCGEAHQKGDLSGAWNYAKGLFNTP